MAADEKAELSYEQAREQLATVVATLEKGGLTLEESLALWEQGEALARRCDTWLASVVARVDGSSPSAD